MIEMDTCPTPYKEVYTKRQAKAVVRDMKSRYRTSKRSMSAVEPYQCPCGAYHLAGKRYQKQRML